jgi:hypothetical protein
MEEVVITRENKLPRAYEVLDSVLVRGDAKELARRLSCSPQLINSWTREPETDSDFTKGKSTGKFSFLDRGREVIAMVKEDDGEPDRAYPIGHYFASLLKGTFVPDLIVTDNPGSDILKCIGDILKDTGKTIETARVFWYEESPGQFTRKEKAKLNADIDKSIAALVKLRQFMRAQ